MPKGTIWVTFRLETPGSIEALAATITPGLGQPAGEREADPHR